jgi:tetratricopeptide (TPR) repeat protein
MSVAASHSSRRGSLTRHRAVLCTGLVVLVGLVYVASVRIPFIYDDNRMVVENLAIRDLSDIRAVLVLEATRPILNLSYAIDYALFGPNAAAFHSVNVLLHAINVVLLFLLAWRLAEDETPSTGPAIRSQVVALSAAVLFAVHPMMTEAVTYVAGRSEVLCTTFFLLAFFCARRWMLGGARGWWLAAVALWVAALGTKEIAAMLPFVLLAYERFVLHGRAIDRRRILWGWHVPLIAVALLGGIVRVAVLAFVEHPGDVVVQWRYALVTVDVLFRYLTLLVTSSGQTIFHAVPDLGWSDPRTGVVLVLLALIVAIIWRVRHLARLGAMGMLWFLLLLVPSSALVVLDRGEPMAEHRVYLASCGLFLMAGTAIAWLSQRHAARGGLARPLFRALLVISVFILAGRTLVRNEVWSDPIGLWAEAVERAPDHWLPHLRLGEVLHNAGRIEPAIAEYKLAIRLRPVEQFAYQKLALVYAEQGRLDEARATFEDLEAQQPQSPIAANGLGLITLMAGDADRARGYFLQAMTLDARNVPARQSLAMIAERDPANPAEALRLCQEIYQLAPRTPGNDDCIRRNRARLGM